MKKLIVISSSLLLILLCFNRYSGAQEPKKEEKKDAVEAVKETTDTEKESTVKTGNTKNKEEGKEEGSFTEEDDRFFPYEADDNDMMPVKVKESLKYKGIQYGGWVTPVFISQKDNTGSLTSFITTARLWMRSYLWDKSFVYIRGKDVYQKIISQSDSYKLSDDNLLDLDLAFISLWNSGKSLRFYIGRKYFLLGSGIVFNGRGDGGQLDFYSRYIDIKLFGAYTGLLNKDNNPYGLSDKDLSEGAKRIFAGGSFSFDLSNQIFYLLGMAQIDRGDQESGVKSRYQSQYYGAGLKGVAKKSISYNGELIFETGTSYTVNNEKSDILAFAGIFNLNYYIDAKLKPVLIAQYAYGSGDKDRSDNKSSNGNISGNDTSFIYFGTYVGGYAIRPLIANIHIIRGGFSIAPFSESNNPYLKRMTIITKYSYYMKDKKSGKINYGEATQSELFVGQGIDISFRWKIFYDLSAFVNYALFLPGNAYNDTENDKSTFLMLGLNISF